MSAKNLNIGAYGWKHAEWSGGFYPDDLPRDWQLTYYSNAFNCVLVPVEYWCEADTPDCEDWLESVHDDFRFHIACDQRLLECISVENLGACLNTLRPALSSLVFLPADAPVSEAAIRRFEPLIESLDVDVFGAEAVFDRAAAIWRQQADPTATRFACTEDDVSDMRAARTMVEAFVQQLPLDSGTEAGEATLIVSDPALEAETLSKLRSVVEIMGL